MNLPPEAPIPNPQTSTVDLHVGQTVGGGRYLLKKILGQGGMGVVWLAHDKRLAEPVALKLLPTQITADATSLESLRRETLRSRKLSHPNIVRIYDLHEAPNEPAFISMEFVEGPDLHWLRARRPCKVLSWNFLAPLARQLCSALEYAHAEGVIHRDIKPANLLLAGNERLKLADFGLASVVKDANVLAAGGTLQYMSPQQANGEKPSITDDIYSLGATLYELLTSRPPFYTGDIAHQVRNTRPQGMEERLLDLGLTNKIPPEVAALMMACLAKQPEQRPQSVGAILEWLERAKQSEHEVTPDLQNRPKEDAVVSEVAQREKGVVLLCLLLAGVLGIGGWAWFKHPAQVTGRSMAERRDSAEVYQNLFNGHDLSGWTGDPRVWSVQENLIVGQGRLEVSGSQTNTYLFWREPVGNFELQLAFKLARGNAGIVYRAKRLAEWDAGGYQYPIGDNSAGGLFDSGWDRARRDLASSPRTPSKLFRQNDWNQAAIIVQGDQFIHKLNGVTVCNVRDTVGFPGLLALKCRPGEHTDTTVYFKDIRLRKLPP